MNMEKNIDLSEYKDMNDRLESQFTILANNISSDEFVSELFHQLKKINSITKPFKRKYLNDRLYDFITHIKQNYGGKLHNVFLVGRHTYTIDLDKRCREIAKEYDVAHYTFMYGDFFHVDIIHDMFNNMLLHDVITVSKDKFNHDKLNKNKKKHIHDGDMSDLNEYAKKLKRVIYNGPALYTKKLAVASPDILLHNKASVEDIMSIIFREEMEKNHADLSDCISMLNHDKEMDKIVYGNDIISAINNYMVKTLFCTPKMESRVRSKFSPEVLNFTMVSIEELEHGDAYTTLSKDYNGLIGIKYY